MTRPVRVFVIAGGSALAAAWALVLLSGAGFTSRREPWPLEARIARAARAFLVPAQVQAAANPTPEDPATLRAGLEHFADHCASCHGNDGSGETALGESLFPRAPDMRSETTQALSDGELFYVIEQGIPFTGMPAWGNGTTVGERMSWELVRFIRHLPHVTPEELEEMRALNPRSPLQDERAREIDDFLRGGSGA